MPTRNGDDAMQVLEKHMMLASPTPDVVSTEGLGERLLASARAAEEKNREGWERMINSFLIPWGQDPSLLDDDEYAPPSAQIIQLAAQVAMKFRDAGAPAPLRVIPDGEGGMSFERQDGKLFESLNISSEAEIELCVFVDCREVGRLHMTA